ncbi:MAG TPA: hypothetical protein VN033_05375 [Vulgatibacter sp.]|nr:hypothetical protein [Vulgatibacter sp.]
MQAAGVAVEEHTHQPHDALTILAIAVLAYVGATLAHEAIGHGLACGLAGGELVGYSSSWAECDKAGIGIAGRRFIEAAGTLVNLAVGFGALLAVRLRKVQGAQVHCFLWLTAAVHLFMGSGYLMVDPLFGFGDWTDFLEGLEPRLAWRLGTSAVGVALYLATFFALRGPLDRMLGGTERARKRQARLLCWLPYLGVGGVILTGAAALNVYGLKFTFTSALATLGGTAMLFWLPLAIDRPESEPTPPAYEIQRSLPWIGAGSVALLFLFAAFGPGIRLGG